jgi:hypothetical protein
MTVHSGRISDFPVRRGVVLSLQGRIPSADDMIRISHENGTHSAAYVVEVSADAMKILILGKTVSFQFCPNGDRAVPEPDEGGTHWRATS